MRYLSLLELKEFAKSLFSRPQTTKFPRQPSVPADKFRGRPQYSKDGCIGCGACAEVCPANAIDVADDLKARTRTLTLRLDSCIFCGNCQANCITKNGITFSSQYDMAAYDIKEAAVFQEKDLLICEFCGSVIGTKDHIKFLAKKLGPLAYGNQTLILANQDGLSLGDVDNRPASKTSFERTLMFKVLCPQCRRAAMLEDEWGQEAAAP